MRLARILLLAALAGLLPSFLFAQSATHVVISEVYGGGGNSGATYTNDFIELYNPTDSLISLDGWSVQYASATGTSYSPTPLSGTIPPKGYYLVQEAQGAGGTVALPTPDAIGTLAMGGTAGKVVLSKATTGVSGIADANVVDFVAWRGTSTPYEGSGPAPATSNTTSIERKANATSTTTSMSSGGADEFAGNGYDSNNNSADFVTRSPQPQNSASPSEPPSSAGDLNPPSVLSVKVLSSDSVDVSFNEPLDSVSAGTASNFTMTGSISVASASRDAAQLSLIHLTVSTMANGIYTLTIQHIADTAGNVMPSAQQRSFVVGVLSVADARAAAPGTTVRVRGVLTVGNEFKSPSFLQDSTGAIGVYSTTFSSGANRGDLWEVTGVLKDYYSLLELDPVIDAVRVSTGNPTPMPEIITSAQLGEAYEGQLVRINRVRLNLSGTFGTSVDSSYTGGDAVGAITLRIDKDSNIPGTPIPADSVNIVGIVNDYLGNYRLMPRGIADIGVIDPPPQQSWMDISVARAQGVGAVVKVRGVVTFSQAGTATNTVYIQDYSGAVAIYDAKANTLVRGDSVEVKGTLVEFSGLLEIQPADSVTLLAQGIALPAPKDITPVTASEYYESQLVTLHNVQFVESGTFTGNTTYHVSDGTTQLDVRIPNLSPLVSLNIPIGLLDLTGVLGQYTTRYQLIPRDDSDLVRLPGPQIASNPSITAQHDQDFTISWTTILPGTTVLYYGATSALTDSIVSSTPATDHRTTVTGLTAGRIYYCQAISRDEFGTSATPAFPVITTSSASSGAINVYFNYPVSTTLGLSPAANGSTALVDKLLEHISAATKTIDIALYSFDDFATPSTIIADRVADSLLAAKARGVSIRMVLRMGLNSAPLSKLAAGGVPMMRRNVTELGSGMHNKFFIFDGRDTTSATDDWVITGSWNVTNDGTIRAAQNAVFIQDQSLARIYTVEFEEMFGSTTDTPNPTVARFGPTKKDNTPHQTVINGNVVEVYFSPSDHTTSAISRALATATQNIFVAQFSFTRDDLAATLVDRKNNGVTVRGLIDNINDTGSQFPFLQGAGLDFLKASHSVVAGDFHHKYGVVDPFNDGSDPLVITGSHNWSSSAENDNDENTVIIHSGPVARQYVQEFAQRYSESGGTGIIVSVETVTGTVPTTTSLGQNYPNPFNPATTIPYRIAVASHVSLKVFDMLGREVGTLVDGLQTAGEYRAIWNPAGLSSGVYFCRLQAGTTTQIISTVLMK